MGGARVGLLLLLAEQGLHLCLLREGPHLNS